MKYIDADLLRKEIKRRITDNTFGAKLELIDILAWLDTLESEKPMQEGLEEEIKSWIPPIKVKVDEDVRGIMKHIREWGELIARHFAEWGYLRAAEKFDEIEYNRQRAEEKPMEQDGLEEELERFIASGKSVTVDDYGTYKVSYHDFKKVARHFAEWQKEQMMKEAIHYVVQDDLDSHGASYNIPFIRLGTIALKPKGIGVGDKVRIIIVKED